MFNEAGEDQGMSSRAVKRAWSSVAANNAGGSSSATVPLAQQKTVVRTQQHGPRPDRMSCNEGNECSMSSKAVAASLGVRPDQEEGYLEGSPSSSTSPRRPRSPSSGCGPRKK